MPAVQGQRIAVIGAGIVGVPMAALLAQAGHDVRVIQRPSQTSGWKVGAINEGRSPIGGIEPELDEIMARAHAAGLLRASHEFDELCEADAILICVQTDKKGFGPDYGPLEDAIHGTARALKKRRSRQTPLLIIESTLAPTSMSTWVTDLFRSHGLFDGKSIFLGNSPNRVMPGRLVERIRYSDKVAGGLHHRTPQLIKSLYSSIVKHGKIHVTNSLTAEIEKTLENAYRDVRIAYAAELARACEERDIDFFALRDEVNHRLDWTDKASNRPEEIPTGGLLIPTVGVGGHCLPKDGILLLWRMIESGKSMDASIILEARRINDESPSAMVTLIEKYFGPMNGRSIALLGTAYRPDSEDARNSPTLMLAKRLQELGNEVHLHDPYVKLGDQNLKALHLDDFFSNDIGEAVGKAELIVFCAAHHVYRQNLETISQTARHAKHIFDCCNLLGGFEAYPRGVHVHSYGRGANPPPSDLIDAAYLGFKAVEKGFANEVASFISFANQHYAMDEFNKTEFHNVKAIAETCSTGCRLSDPGRVEAVAPWCDFSSRLALKAAQYE